MADPDPLSPLRSARKVLAAVEAAESIGLLEAVAGGPVPAGQLADSFDLRPEPLHALLRVLRWHGVLDDTGAAGWQLSEVYRELLTGPPGSNARALLRIERWAAQDHLNADGVTAALRGRRLPTEIPDAELPALADAMLTGARASAPHLARLPELRDRTSLADIAGGSGGYSLTLCRMFRGLTATVYDRAPMLEHAARAVKEAELGDRVRLVPWDLHRDPLAGPEAGEASGPAHDAALLSHVLHLLDRRERVRLLTGAGRLLPGGGLLLVHDFLYEEPPAGSALAASAVDWLALGAAYHPDRRALAAELAEAGFTLRRTVPLPALGTTVAVATRD
ncbi:class I SAM-dependent methyltransferase [Streptomyces sp. b94]|uniref:class I SAM-dependent methyltransferase n=1 Tax=Streptomyces sp. b94 TaxID=1827634 RepID=UPI000BEFA797|nr:class I SAM-dependent methyltransferase [Streptomyces sp. b94]